jgi:lysyl-tRNA synthetase class 2
MDDVEALIDEVARTLKGRWRPRAVERLSVSEAFVRAGLADPLDYHDVAELRRALGVPLSSGTADTWDDVFFRAFLERIEPRFDDHVLTILYGWPAGMAALAQLDPGDPRRAERFEVYAGRVELGNAFGELTESTRSMT